MNSDQPLDLSMKKHGQSLQDTPLDLSTNSSTEGKPDHRSSRTLRKRASSFHDATKAPAGVNTVSCLFHFAKHLSVHLSFAQ